MSLSNIFISKAKAANSLIKTLVNTSAWKEFCDVTLTLKQARKLDHDRWIKLDEIEARGAFRHFMNLLNRAVYGNSRRRHGKRLRVVPVLEKAEFAGRWHYHAAIELPPHIDAIRLEELVHACWSKVQWSLKRVLVRDGTNEGWINYMLKPGQKAQFEHWSDSIDWESLYNPIA
jgi:hypothetical protein